MKIFDFRRSDPYPKPQSSDKFMGNTGEFKNTCLGYNSTVTYSKCKFCSSLHKVHYVHNWQCALHMQINYLRIGLASGWGTEVVDIRRPVTTGPDSRDRAAFLLVQQLSIFQSTCFRKEAVSLTGMGMEMAISKGSMLQNTGRRKLRVREKNKKEKIQSKTG